MADVEVLTQEIGREIFARLGHGGSMLLSPSWIDERLMEWTMSDEAVKIQLFRFIDVLPTLTTSAEVTRHLREYFDEAGEAVPGWIRRAMRWLPVGGYAARLVAKAARSNAKRMARRFIAGSNVAEVLDSVADMRRRTLAFTVDLLGEATITEAESDRYQAEYLEMIEGLCMEVNAWDPIDAIDRDHEGPISRVNVSIKFSSLYSQFDPIDPERTSRAVRARLRPILRSARRHGAFVNVDMEQYAFKDLTLRIFKEVLEESEFRDWEDVGIAIQAYLRDCEADLQALLAWVRQRGTPVWVRLVKGAYWDFETVMADQLGWPVPVFTQKWQSDANYETLTRFLMENYRQLRPALATHNIRSMAHALALAQHYQMPARSFELQMLYGMADPIKDAMTSLGQRVRVYTPFGQLLPGMAYLVRRLLENTANDSFLRASFTENISEDQLLRNPQRKAMSMHVSPNGQANRPGVRPGFQIENDPITDFAREDNRRAMLKALEEVKKQFGRTYPLVINGQSIHTPETIDSVNPSRHAEVVGKCAKASVAHAEQAIAASKQAFLSWRDVAPRERAEYLFRAAEIMQRRRFELAAWETYECGKQWREADADVAEAIDFCNYYGREMIRLATPQRRDVPGENNEYFYESRGVAVVIAPWNFPLAILCGMAVSALVTGNTVILKPAEQSSVVGAKLMEILQEAGVPAGAVHFLPGIGEEIGPTLVQHRDVALISFTGSRGVGLHINHEAAHTPKDQEHVKRVLAEMGGKNAVIVDADADLDEAVAGVVGSAFGYSGQKCSACSRAIVLDVHYDTFVNRLVEAARSIKVLPAEDPGSYVGPVIDSDAQARIVSFIEDAKKECKLVFGADVGELAQQGYFVGPHIFAEVSPNARLAQEEIFGPVLAVVRARDLTHALEIANGTPYALTGGIYSRSPENLARVKREFRVGNLYVNRKITGALVERQPFGGFKMSGIGAKAGGPDYLTQLMVPRVITENTLRRGFAPPVETPQSAGAVVPAPAHSH